MTHTQPTQQAPFYLFNEATVPRRYVVRVDRWGRITETSPDVARRLFTTYHHALFIAARAGAPWLIGNGYRYP